MFKTTPHFTITGTNKNGVLSQVFGSENLKTFPGVIRKTEKFMNTIIQNTCQNLYFQNVYYIIIEDNFNRHNIIYKRKLSDIIIECNGDIKFETQLKSIFKFIKESPEYYIHLPKEYNDDYMLELRSYNSSFNELCLQVENIINEYLNNNQKAA